MLFFALLIFAALTSSISPLEPVVELLEERTPMGRVASTVVAGVATWALGVAARFFDREGVREDLGLGRAGFSVWNVLARYVAPAGVIAVFWHSL